MTVSLKIIKNGTTFNIADFGLALTKHDIPPNPPNEIIAIEIPGSAGKRRMGVQIKERTFNLEFILMANDPTVDYQSKVAGLSELFDNTSGPYYLIFGDMPGKRFLGEYNGAPDIGKMIFDGKVTIPIVCEFPFTETVTDISGGWGYGDGYTYGMGMRYGDEYSFPMTVSPATIDIYHAGNVPLPPRITITGQFTNMSISVGLGNVCTITRTNGALDVIEIDCKESTVYLNDTTNIYSESNGVFFILPKGVTTFTITASGVIDYVIAFSPFRHRYTY